MTFWLAERAKAFETRHAILAAEGIFTYGHLLGASERTARRLLARRDATGPSLRGLDGARICFLVSPGWGYVVTQWGIWRAGGVAVPLAISHPSPELAHVLHDLDPELVVVEAGLRSRLESVARELRIPLLDLDDMAGSRCASRSRSDRLRRRLAAGVSRRRQAGSTSASPDGEGRAAVDLPVVTAGDPAMILYTSGTAGSPKGVVIDHGHLQNQVESLSEAWSWTAEDRILLHLPLHHVHGIVNVLLCSLRNGALCEILPRFNAIDVWERLARTEITLYMGVPTTYRRLADTWKLADSQTRGAWSAGARGCRLMVSGSAALPVPLLESWEEITGQRLLERYGMTEIGMALSNPLEGERRAGTVGHPLPGVELRLVNEEGEEPKPGFLGEIHVRGPTVFGRYWDRTDETAEAFTEDGWFRTGDLASVDEDGYYRILGRSSQDILKTGGEKISALEIEGVIRSHPGVLDCAVVGVGDDDWGDRVCAAVVGKASSRLAEEELAAWARGQLAPYKVPKEIRVVSSLPRNALGKVIKPAVKELFGESR